MAVLAAIYGLGRAVDIPARQSYITDLVGRPDLPNAVALNSLVFNGARIVGPAVAGLLIARFGVALAFFLNGLSFVAVLGALLATRTAGRSGSGRAARPPGRGLGALTMRRARRRSRSRSPCSSSISVLVLNFNVVVPLVAKDVLNEGAHGFGLLMSSLGAGAVMAGRRPDAAPAGSPLAWSLAAPRRC